MLALPVFIKKSSVVFLFVLCLPSAYRAMAAPIDEDSLSVLRKKIDALPARTSEETWKKTALGLGLDEAEHFRSRSSGQYVSMLMKETSEALSRPAISFGRQNQDSTHIGSLKAPYAAASNPYIDKLTMYAMQDFKAMPDRWAMGQGAAISGPKKTQPDYRIIGHRMRAALWLLANPASPMKGDETVLRAFFQYYLTYLHAVLDSGSATKAGSGMFDDFAVSPASCAFREFAAIYPGLLLPSQKHLLDSAMRIAADAMYKKADGRPGKYANIDIALSYQMLNFGLYFPNDARLMERAKFLMEAQVKNVYADGAIAYIGTQNESHNYHGADISYLSAYYLVEPSPVCKSIIRSTEWYGPVSSGKLGEFWTVPSWKGTWNTNSAIPHGGEPVVALTGNPYVRWQIDLERKKSPEGDLAKHWEDLFEGVHWFRADVRPVPLPENYFIYDRNIQGPRSWQGKWNLAATLRKPDDSEPGLQTVMGMQTVNDNNILEDAVMGVFPRVRLKKDVIDKDRHEVKQAYAWLTSGQHGSLAMGKDFCGFGIDYLLHAFGSSQKGPLTDWTGKQMWLALQDRAIGFLEVRPKAGGAKAFEVDGVVRLAYGGTATAPTPKKAVQIGDKTYSYGHLVVRVLDHNFSKVSAREVPFRLPKVPVTDIVLQDGQSLAAPGDAPMAYPDSSVFYYMVELKPEWTKGEAKVEKSVLADGTYILRAECDKNQYVLWYNPTEDEHWIEPMKQGKKGARASLHTSDAPDAKPLLPVPAKFLLRPRASALWVSGPDPRLHEATKAYLPELLKDLGR